jgi:hypothetical protein
LNSTSITTLWTNTSLAADQLQAIASLIAAPATIYELYVAAVVPAGQVAIPQTTVPLNITGYTVLEAILVTDTALAGSGGIAQTTVVELRPLWSQIVTAKPPTTSANISYVLTTTATSATGAVSNGSTPIILSVGTGPYLPGSSGAATCGVLAVDVSGGAPPGLLNTGTSTITGVMVLSDALPVAQLVFHLPQAPTPGEIVTITCTSQAPQLAFEPPILQLDNTTSEVVNVTIVQQTNNSAVPYAGLWSVSCSAESSFGASRILAITRAGDSVSPFHSGTSVVHSDLGRARRLPSLPTYGSVAPFSLSGAFLLAQWPFFQVQKLTILHMS